MDDVVNLVEYKLESRARKIFASWKKRFDMDFDCFTRLSDLCDEVLFSLVKSEDADTLLHEVVMANLDMGPASKFPFLDEKEQRLAAGMTLFLRAQIFFEIMFRLGWVVEYPCRRYSILNIVESRAKGREFKYFGTPVLSDSLEESSTYEKLSWHDKRKFLEERFDRALALFEKTVKNK